MRAPGTLERTLGAGSALGIGASLLSSFAMGFAGSMIAQSLFSAMGGFGDPAAADAADDTGASADEQETAQADEDYGDDGGFDDGGDFDV